jgi:hypothetical protein
LDGNTPANTLPAPNTLQDLITAGGRWEIGIDVDPSDDVEFHAFDPISYVARGGGACQFDSVFLDNDETAINVLANPPPTPADFPAWVTSDLDPLLTTSSGIQNSIQPRFLTGCGITGLTGTDLDNATPTLENDGRYEVYFAYSEGGVEVMRVAFSVFKGTYTSSDTPADLAARGCMLRPSE